MLHNKAGYTNRQKSRGLGRGSSEEGRSSGGAIYSISHVQLGRSGDARKCSQDAKKVNAGQTDGTTDGPTNMVTYRVA